MEQNTYAQRQYQKKNSCSTGITCLTLGIEDIAQFHSFKCSSLETPSFPLKCLSCMKSFTEVSRYTGGFSSDSNSLIGPYTLEVSGQRCCLKKHATEILGPISMAITLWLALINLPLEISCKKTWRNVMKLLGWFHEI